MRAISRDTRKRTTLAAVAFAVLLGVGGTARLAAGDDGEARLQKLTVDLKEKEVADEKRHAATTDIGKAEALRDKARTLVSKRRDRDALARTLDELEATLELVGAKITAAEAKAKLDEQKAKMAKVKEQLAKVKAEADKLEKQQAEIEKKLGGGK
jgi:chromosome segregation ATPase